MINKPVIFVLGAVLLLTSCQPVIKKDDNIDSLQKDSAILSKPHAGEPIQTMVLKEQTFNRKLAGNGKVSALHSSELHFQTREQIAHVWVKNGDRVRAGQKLAQLDLFRLERAFAQAKDNLTQSELELQDVLIGRGYSLDKQDQVSDEEMELAKVKSGYNRALIAYQLAEEELDKATLYAPFDGVIVNLNTKELNPASTNTPFCLVLNDKQMEIQFSVLESELLLVKKGCQVEVSPFASKTIVKPLYGTVTEINPYVESNGMVKVKALVQNNGALFEGMNVNVLLSSPLSRSLVIPKSAVVMRSGKTVVFTKMRGKAQWNYVQILTENNDSCVVSPRSKEYEGLAIGDTVIIKGNINLAHESEI
ncbi:MAG: efflux RND transporter periplasmic adaptor subunit [Prevotella sp.]|nr:efflux RND transporter periplasmic adaptor subunit [Prevotella sp.]